MKITTLTHNPMKFYLSSILALASFGMASHASAATTYNYNFGASTYALNGDGSATITWVWDRNGAGDIAGAPATIQRVFTLSPLTNSITSGTNPLHQHEASGANPQINWGVRPANGVLTNTTSGHNPQSFTISVGALPSIVGASLTSDADIGIQLSGIIAVGGQSTDIFTLTSGGATSINLTGGAAAQTATVDALVTDSPDSNDGFSTFSSGGTPGFLSALPIGLTEDQGAISSADLIFEAVPEPSSALLGLLGLTLLGRRSRR